MDKNKELIIDKYMKNQDRNVDMNSIFRTGLKQLSLTLNDMSSVDTIRIQIMYLYGGLGQFNIQLSLIF